MPSLNTLLARVEKFDEKKTESDAEDFHSLSSDVNGFGVSGVSCDTTKVPTNCSVLHPLKAFTYLKLLCTHPALVVSKDHSAYRNRLVQDIHSSGKFKALIRLLITSGIVHREEIFKKSCESDSTWNSRVRTGRFETRRVVADSGGVRDREGEEFLDSLFAEDCGGEVLNLSESDTESKSDTESDSESDTESDTESDSKSSSGPEFESEVSKKSKSVSAYGACVSANSGESDNKSGVCRGSGTGTSDNGIYGRDKAKLNSSSLSLSVSDAAPALNPKSLNPTAGLKTDLKSRLKRSHSAPVSERVEKNEIETRIKCQMKKKGGNVATCSRDDQSVYIYSGALKRSTTSTSKQSLNSKRSKPSADKPPLASRSTHLGSLNEASADTHSRVQSISRKCLIFAQHTGTLDLLETCVMKRFLPSVSYRRLDGGVAPLVRAGTYRLCVGMWKHRV